MIRLVLLLLFLGPLALCCASTADILITTPGIASVPQPEPIPLLGSKGGAHACPVIVDDVSVILTAKHVAFRRHIAPDGEEIYFPRKWQAEVDGEIATAVAVIQHNYVDLAVLRMQPEPKKYFNSGEFPSDGDTVYWKEYDFRTAKRAYKPRLRSAKVVNGLAGHIFLDKPPTSGASGSCAFDDNFDVIGIISFGQGMDDRSAISGIVSIENMR